jgi:hypothetical protein
VLEEKGLDGCNDSARTSLVLEDAVLHPIVKVKALAPGFVEISLIASKQQLFYSLLFLQRDATYRLRAAAESITL